MPVSASKRTQRLLDIGKECLLEIHLHYFRQAPTISGQCVLKIETCIPQAYSKERMGTKYVPASHPIYIAFGECEKVKQ